MICNVIRKVVGFVAVPVYTRLVSAEEYGYYSIFQSWETVLVIFATLNMHNYLYSKGMIKYEDEKEGFTSALIGLSGLLTVMLFIIYILFQDYFEKLSRLPFVAVFMMFLLFFFQPSYNYWCSRQRFEYKIVGLVWTSVFIVLITPVVSVVLILLCKRFDMGNLGMALIAGKVLCPVAVYIPVFFMLLSRCKKIFDREIWRFALRFNLPLIPHFLSMVVLQQSDRIMIGYMCGNRDAGIYSVAYSVGVVMLFVNSAIIDTIIPWTYKRLKDKVYDGIAIVGTYTVLIIAAVNLLLALFAPEFISIMAPAEYSKAAYVIPPVAISNVFICMFNLCANIEYYFEETKFVMLASLTGAIANIVLNYLFIQRYGFMAAGYTTVACYMIYALCHCIFMGIVLRKHKVDHSIYNLRLIWMIALGAVIFAIAIIGIYDFIIIRMLIVALIVSVLFIKRSQIKAMYMNVRKNR